MHVERERFLHVLESVQGGLTTKDLIEQSSCFVFREGLVITYNDEVAVQAVSGLDKEFNGAVEAAPLLSILQKIEKETLTVLFEEGMFVLKAGVDRVKIRMQAEITLPVQAVESPTTWKPLHDRFLEAIQMVQECAALEESQFNLSCVHIHPKWVEACDNYQLCRWKLKTGIEKPTLVRQTAIKHISSLAVKELSETPAWVHFRGSDGLIFSCRRYMDEFVDITDVLKVEGQTVSLPKGLGKLVEKAEVFSSENAVDNQVFVRLTQDNKVEVKGEGAKGEYRGKKTLVGYDGPAFGFLIKPKLLLRITEKHNECILADNRLKIDGGHFQYVACLTVPEEQAPKKPERKKKEKAEVG